MCVRSDEGISKHSVVVYGEMSRNVARVINSHRG